MNEARTLVRAFCYLLHQWLSDGKDIRPIKPFASIPKCSFMEQMEEDDNGDLDNAALPGKMSLKQM